MNPSSYLWLTAGIAGITATWSQVRSMFERFLAFFFVSAHLDRDAASAFTAYLYDRARLSPFSSNLYAGHHSFIRPKDRYGIVAFRMVGSSMTFFLGWVPLFITNPTAKSANESGYLSVSYFRGTFDIEQALVKAMDAWNQVGTGITPDTKMRSGRYRVRRVMGKRMGNNRGRDHAEKDSPTIGVAPLYDTRNMVPLGYSREDLVAPTQKNPFSLLFYSPQVNDFVKQVKNWFKSEDWYRERNISWRFGGAFYGPPGTGKTSLARALAQDLDIPINMVDLTTMDNNDLVEAWSEIVGYAPCIVLLEDLDRVYDANAEAKAGDYPHQHAGPTMDCLLNCISGVEPSDGILVLATANDITKLDPALGVPDEHGKSTRPGRLDVCVYLGPLTEDGRRSVALRILPTDSHDHRLTYNPADYVDQLVKDGDGETGAQFTKRCADKALELYWRKAE